MEGFTYVDGAVAVVILISAILAYSRGFVRESLAILGWVGAAAAAFYLTPTATPLVGEVPILNEFLDGNVELSVIVAFVAVFVVALIIISIFIPLISGAVQRSALGGVDQGLGFLFGVLRGALLVIVALIVYDRVLIGEPVAAVDDSRTAKIFAELQDDVADSIPSDVPAWIAERYEELVASGAPAEE
ncbi:MAG: CvpA family protein [Pseudomonadota bacterium]